MKSHRMFVRHKDGGDERLVRRIMLPGKHTGWLGVGEHGNVFNIYGAHAWWVFDIHDEGIPVTDRAAIVTAAQRVLDRPIESVINDIEWGKVNPRAGFRVGIFVTKGTANE